MGLCPKPRFILFSAKKNKRSESRICYLKQIYEINMFLTFKSDDRSFLKAYPREEFRAVLHQTCRELIKTRPDESGLKH